MRQLGYLACQRFCLIFTKRDACEFKNQHGLACGVHTHSGKRLFENKRGVRLCANKKKMDVFSIMGCFPDTKLGLPAPPVRTHADGKC